MGRDFRRGVRAALAALAVVFVASMGSLAASPQRIASLNMCTDQLLLALADPEQIAALSPYARNRTLSFMADKAGGFPTLSGEAEDVLMLAPDLTVAGRFTRAVTRAFLRAHGAPLVEFDAVRSLDEAKEQILRMGDLVGHPGRAAAAVARIDAAIGQIRAAALKTPRRVLALSRRGWTPGADSLVTSLLATAGLANAAPDLGFKSGGFASLEAIVTLKPDFLLLAEESENPEDQGQAFLLHPALERLYPQERRILIPERLTVCGGPMLADALERLADALGRLPKEPPPGSP